MKYRMQKLDETDAQYEQFLNELREKNRERRKREYWKQRNTVLEGRIYSALGLEKELMQGAVIEAEAPDPFSDLNIAVPTAEGTMQILAEAMIVRGQLFWLTYKHGVAWRMQNLNTKAWRSVIEASVASLPEHQAMFIDTTQLLERLLYLKKYLFKK